MSVLLIKDKAGGLNENGQKRITVFLAPKVLLVQQVLQTLQTVSSLVATSGNTIEAHTHQPYGHCCTSKCGGCNPEDLVQVLRLLSSFVGQHSTFTRLSELHQPQRHRSGINGVNALAGTCCT